MGVRGKIPFSLILDCGTFLKLFFGFAIYPIASTLIAKIHIHNSFSEIAIYLDCFGIMLQQEDAAKILRNSFA